MGITHGHLSIRTGGVTISTVTVLPARSRSVYPKRQRQSIGATGGAISTSRELIAGVVVYTPVFLCTKTPSIVLMYGVDNNKVIRVQ